MPGFGVQMQQSIDGKKICQENGADGIIIVFLARGAPGYPTRRAEPGSIDVRGTIDANFMRTFKIDNFQFTTGRDNQIVGGEVSEYKPVAVIPVDHASQLR